MPRASSRPRGRWVAIALLAVYTVFVCSVTLTPRSPGDGALTRLVKRVLEDLHARGILLWVDFLTVEFLGNVLLFVPLGVLSALVLDRRAWWVLLVAGTVFSGAIELAQLLLLPERYPDWRDLVSNTIGFLIGAGGMVLVRSRRERGITKRA